MPAVATLVGNFTTYVINPAILVVFAGGFFLFMWGLVVFLWGIREGKAPDEGKQHMIWGIVGMVIMVSVFGIITLINNTFGLGLSPTTTGNVNGAGNNTNNLNAFQPGNSFNQN